MFGSAAASSEGVDETGGDTPALVVGPENVDGRVFPGVVAGPVRAPLAAAGAVDGRPRLDPGTGCTAVVEGLAGRGRKGLATDALGVFEEAAGGVEVVEELGVGVGLGVAVRMVDAHGNGGTDGIALAVLAGAGPGLPRVAVEGGVLGAVAEVRFEGAEAGGEDRKSVV